jgi:putative sigma-54 modulation protein
MVVNVSFKQLDSSEAFRDFVKEKSGTLGKYFDGRITVTWNFHKEREDFIAHCHLVGNGMDYFGEAAATDIHGSVDLVLDKVEKQIRRHKEILKDHHHRDRLAPSE